MADFDNEMWQDFVVEVRENLEEFEPNLLLLEQQPTDKSLLNDCFRNMHSIKGAANYMGFSKMGELAHKIENLMDMARQGEAPLTQQSFDVIFKAVDWFRKFLDDIEKNHRETLDVSQLFNELEALKVSDSSKTLPQSGSEEDVDLDMEVDGEEDDELLTIFHEEMRSLYGQLASMLSAKEVSSEAPASILEDMERITNYMGHEALRSEITRLKDEVSSGTLLVSDDSGKERLLTELKEALRKETGLELTEKSATTSGSGAEIEDDQELYAIFLDFFNEVGSPLAHIPTDFDHQWVQNCQKAIEKLKTSANYMDYMEVVRIFEEWEERLAEVLSATESYKPDTFRTLWEQLVGILPGLADVLEYSEISKDNKEEAAETASDETSAIDSGSLDVIIDSAIDSLIEGDASGSGDDGITFEEIAAPAGIPDETGEKIQAQEELLLGQSQKGAESQGPKTTVSSKTVRVNLEKVEHLLQDVAELVVLRSSLQKDKTDLENLYSVCANERMLPTAQLRQLKEILLGVSERVSALERVVNQLQDGVMRIRMLPVSHLFGRFPRMVRDISRKVHKDVELVISGADTALDKQIMEQLADPLQHIIRNAVDHGIETPEERRRQGKPQKGTLSLSAFQEGNFVVITISDDGKGLDRDAIVKKASSLGLIPPEKISSLTESQVHQLIFAPGFSTAETVSDLSGRGVGLDVVKKNIERIGGTVMVRSVKGKGTTILLRIPLTLAIVRGLIVKVGNQSMVIPVSNIFETFRLNSNEISQVEGYEMISRRQETLPLIRLSSIFRGTGAREDNEKLFAVRVRAGELEACLGVDALVGQQEVVIKPLSDYLMDQPGFAGATILGDGSIALILDLGAVVEKSKGFILKRQQVLEQQALGSSPGAENVFH